MSIRLCPSRSAAICSERRAHGGHPGVAVLVDAVAEAHDLPLVGQGLWPATVAARSGVPISAIMSITASLAPPCSGPLSAPIAAVTAL